MTSPILTLTVNPLAETTYVLGGAFVLGATHRAVAESFQVGGKGLNVAKMLHRLGAPVTALSFAGGATGDACRNWLREHAAYGWHLIPTSAPTRAGWVVRDTGGRETSCFAPDRPLDGAAAQSAANWLRQCPEAPLVALCGSFPGWGEEALAPLRAELVALARMDRLVVDSYGPALHALVQEPLALVKINRVEFNALMTSADLEPTLEAARERFPVQRWIVTDGPRAIEYATESGRGEVQPPTTPEVSATGSGDVFFAAVLASTWRNAAAWPSPLDYSARLAALNAAHPGVADFDLPV